MTARSSSFLLLLSLAGCVAARRPDREPEPDAGFVWAVVEQLHSPDPARRALAESLLDEIGPAGGPTLRGLLTRRTEQPDPFIRELIASLDAGENLLADAARDQIALRGRRAAPDLWEALLATESPVLAVRALELLARLEGPARVGSAVEALWAWGSAPEWLDQVSAFASAQKRLAPVWEPDGEPTFVRRSRKLTEEVTMHEFLEEIDKASAIPAVTFVVQEERIFK
jgi:hypothetical protein